MLIKISTVEKILKLEEDENSLGYIRMLLEELCEPIAVKNFKYFGNLYPVRLLRLLTYKFDNGHVEIELSEEFLYAEQEYMIARFLVC